MRSWTAPPANDSQAPRGAYRSQHWPAGASASSLSAALATPAPRQLEQDMYRDTVTLTVSAEQRGRESEAVDNPNVAIGLESVEPGVLKLHFEGQGRPGERYPHLLQPDHRPHLLRPDPRRRGQRERRLDDLRKRHARPGATGLIDSPSQPSTMRKAAKWHFDTHPRRSIDSCRTDTEVVVQHVNVFDSSPHDEPFRDIPGPLPGDQDTRLPSLSRDDFSACALPSP